MPRVNIQGFGAVNFPDSMSPDQIQQAIERDVLPQISKPLNPADQSQYPEATPFNNFMAGMASGVKDLGMGIGQRVGLVKQEAVDANKKYEAPLLKSTAGSLGSLAGNLAVAAPTAFIPGANTVLGASLIGGALGAAQPTATGESALKNAAMGLVLGGAGQYGLGKLANLAGSRLASVEDAGKKLADQNATKDATLQAARAAGYRIPPVQANPTLMNRALEGFAGKLSTAQQASVKNQGVTDSLIKADLGLPANASVTPEALRSIRGEAGKAYAAVKDAGAILPDEEFASQVSSLGGSDYAAVSKDFPELANPAIAKLSEALNKPGFSASSAVSLIKQLRKEATANFTAAKAAGGDPSKLALAGAQDDAASALENLIDRNLMAQGKPEVMQQFRDARTLIAKTHAAERALNPATGSFNARDIAKLYDKGKPLSGGMMEVGRFANAFPKAAQEITSSMPGVSPLDYAAVGAVSAAAHNPGIMASLMGRPIARSVLLSKPYQKAFAGPPSYEAGLLTKMAPSTLRELEKLGISGLLGPSIYAAQ